MLNSIYIFTNATYLMPDGSEQLNAYPQPKPCWDPQSRYSKSLERRDLVSVLWAF